MTEPWYTRTPHGWVEPMPTPCPRCGGTRHLVGWHACACGGGALTGGHRTWSCRECGHLRIIGCRGQTGVAPMGIRA